VVDEWLTAGGAALSHVGNRTILIGYPRDLDGENQRHHH
jgi:hypothetical protein